MHWPLLTVEQSAHIKKCSLMYEANKTHSHRLHQFLAHLTRLVDSSPTESELLAQGRPLLQDLLSHDDWLPPESAQANPHHYQQYLLYADPQERFAVVSFVWGPGQSTPIHDHTVWGLMGVLRGRQACQAYSRMSDGRWVAAGLEIDMLPGDIEAVSPRIGDVHKVWNALPDQVSVSIHVYGGHIGKIERHCYREDGSRSVFISGYANQPAGSVASTLHNRVPPPVQASLPTPVATPPAPAPAPAPAHHTPSVAAPVVQEAVVESQAHGFAISTYQEVRQALLDKQELALVDVREEEWFAQSHPLFAIHLPYGRLEVDSRRRIPRLDTPIVLMDAGDGLAARAASVLQRMGYSQLSILQNGLAGWAAGGGELFRDLNVPSKAFGEWVQNQRKTPSLSPTEVKALADSGADMVIMDAREFDAYHAMTIPGAINVPGGELVLRARSLAPNVTTRIVVLCADRSQSIIGTQSLVNAGIPNPVCALRNGTLGWMLAGLDLQAKADRRFGDVSEADRQKTAASALALLFRCGVQRIDLQALQAMQNDATRNTYLFDVRTAGEYEAGHLPKAVHAPGGQLVQETDHFVGVRGARIVLYDDDGVRASMAASWLAQMGWEAYVLKDLQASDLHDTQAPSPDLPATLAPVEEVDPVTLKDWLANRSNLSMVIDVGDSTTYVKRHIPGAWWLLRSQLAQDFSRVHKANRYILTCADGQASRYAVAQLQPLVRAGVQVLWLKGGNRAWMAQGFSTQQGESYLASPRIDRYRRPDEVPAPTAQAIQAYLEWQQGLIEQLRRDGTHHFKAI